MAIQNDLLATARDAEDINVALTWSLLADGSFGEQGKNTHQCINDGLYFLSGFASCHWGCRGGNHTLEKIIRRGCNYTHAALRLAWCGYYDEAIAELRCLAEITNLLQLFSLDQKSFEKWSAATTKPTIKEFSPIKVRLTIESLGRKPSVSAAVYAKLCDLGVHVSPNAIAISHQFGATVAIGATFSVPAFLLILSQTSELLSGCLTACCQLIDLPDDPKKIIQDVLAALENDQPLDLLSYESMLSDFRTQTIRETLMSEIPKLSEEKFQSLLKEAVQASGVDLSDVRETEKPAVQDRVYQSICAILADEIRKTLDGETMNWASFRGQAAYVEHLKEQIIKYQPNHGREE